MESSWKILQICGEMHCGMRFYSILKLLFMEFGSKNFTQLWFYAFEILLNKFLCLAADIYAQLTIFFISFCHHRHVPKLSCRPVGLPKKPPKKRIMKNLKKTVTSHATRHNIDSIWAVSLTSLWLWYRVCSSS